MKKNQIKNLIISAVIASAIITPILTTQAQNTNPNPLDRLQKTAGAANLSTTGVGPQEIVVGLIIIVLSLLGLTFLVLIIYAGFTWMTSQGDKDKIEKAQKTITSSAIGLAIVLASYAIVTFISKVILEAYKENFWSY